MLKLCIKNKKPYFLLEVIILTENEIDKIVTDFMRNGNTETFKELNELEALLRTCPCLDFNYFKILSIDASKEAFRLGLTNVNSINHSFNNFTEKNNLKLLGDDLIAPLRELMVNSYKAGIRIRLQKI